MAAARSSSADTIISAQFGTTNFGAPFQPYSGVEPDAAAADPAFANSSTWNHLAPTDPVNGAISFTGLVDSTGTNTGASLNLGSYINGGFNNSAGQFPDSYIFSTQPLVSFSIDGLAPGTSYVLFLYAYNDAGSRNAVYQVGSSSFYTAAGNPNSEDPVNVVDGSLSGVTSASGSIDGTWNFAPGNTGEMDWSGFQLDLQPPAAATPEPAPFVLLGTGLLGVVGAARRRFSA